MFGASPLSGHVLWNAWDMPASWDMSCIRQTSEIDIRTPEFVFESQVLHTTGM